MIDKSLIYQNFSIKIHENGLIAAINCSHSYFFEAVNKLVNQKIAEDELLKDKFTLSQKDNSIIIETKENKPELLTNLIQQLKNPKEENLKDAVDKIAEKYPDEVASVISKWLSD